MIRICHNSLELDGTDAVTLPGTSAAVRVSVTASAAITLQNLSIDMTGKTVGASAFALGTGGTSVIVDLTLVGTNELTGADEAAGLHVPQDAELTALALAPSTELLNSQFSRPITNGLIERSARLLDSPSRPSRKTFISHGHHLRAAIWAFAFVLGEFVNDGLKRQLRQIVLAFVDGLQLALRLQNDTRAYLSASDCGDEFVELGNLPDVRELVEKAANVETVLDKDKMHTPCGFGRVIVKI